MGVNKKICKELRQMTKNYGGFGYFDLNIDNLRARFFFISRHWDLPFNSGIVLRHCYETFWISVGLRGNIFELDYDSLGQLAEHSWFKHRWRLCHMFLSPIIFNTKYEVPLMRQRDKPIMDVFRESGIWQMEQLLVFQCMWRYKCVYALSDTFECDGRTVMSSMIDQKEQASGLFLKRNLEGRTLTCGTQHFTTLPHQCRLPLALTYNILIKMWDGIHHLTTFTCINRTLVEWYPHLESYQVLRQQEDGSIFRV